MRSASRTSAWSRSPIGRRCTELWPSLPERERQILLLRFFANMTQSEIADRVGVSQMHVSRLLKRTLSDLREILLVED